MLFTMLLLHAERECKELLTEHLTCPIPFLKVKKTCLQRSICQGSKNSLKRLRMQPTFSLPRAPNFMEAAFAGEETGLALKLDKCWPRIIVLGVATAIRGKHQV